MSCVDPQSVAPNSLIHDPGLYPVMIASCKSPSAHLSVVYELARANTDSVVPHGIMVLLDRIILLLAVGSPSNSCSRMLDQRSLIR
jgi:hypothetical protein